MRETVYLVISRQRVERMTKNVPELKRGEIFVKVLVEADASAFRPPTIEQSIVISDWRQGLDVPDVDLTEMTITEAEAEQIRKQRLAAVIASLEDLGYKIDPPAPGPEETCEGGC